MKTELYRGIHDVIGGVALEGEALEIVQALDRRFVTLARESGATPIQFPPLLPLVDLERSGYLGAFPHLTTLAAHVAEEQCEEFAAKPGNRLGEVDPGRLAPAAMALTPAACTPLYPHLRGEGIAQTRVYTTTNTCFRHESTVATLRRQRSFTMREMMWVGDPGEINRQLAIARRRVDGLVRRLELPVLWRSATDPFFGGAETTAAVLQRATDLKRELVYGPDLALASTNRHGDHFGTAFDIQTVAGPAHSACLAFGLERWLHAALECGISAREIDRA